MTRDEILSKQPGPELDIAIGKLLFGAKVRSYRKYEGGTLLYKLILNRKTFADAFCEPDGPWSAMPKYSTSWEGMRLLVEAMAAKGYWLKLTTPDALLDIDQFCAEFRKFGIDEFIISNGEASGATAPHAACLAARLALEGEHAEL